MPASTKWFHCVQFSQDTGHVVTFLVLNSICDIEKSAVPVPYLIPSLKKGYIQCTGTLLLIGNYPSANYPPSWDHPFDDPLWGPNLTLSFYIAPREKIYDFKKHRIGSIFFAYKKSSCDWCRSKNKETSCIFALSEIKDITDQNDHYRIFQIYINLCAMCENHLYTERLYIGFWCWTQFSMLIKVPEFAWTTVNLYSSWESVCPTSGIKLNTKKRSLCPVNCDRLFCFSEFFKANDAEVRIKRPKTCIFVYSVRGF